VVSKRWNLTAVDPALRDRLSREATCSSTIADLLIRRGITEREDAARFLAPKLLHLGEPDALPDLDLAVSRLDAALARNEKIAIFGDYDVDGITSTCLLLDFFRQLERTALYRLPNRLRDGYGLSLGAIEAFAAQGIDLVITVDNGSSARREIARAAELGIDVIVIDHHQPSSDPPRPVALVNPWCAPTADAFRDLAGVGVTFKFVWAMCQRLSRAKKLSPQFRNFLLDSLALVALGTISDVVPLHGENRVFAKFGLQALATSRRPGLRALVDLAQRGNGNGARSGDRPRLDASDVAFRIGPRINAAGRLGDAEVAIRLLTTDDPATATRLAGELDRENRRRREIEAEITAQARQRVLDELDVSRDRAIVLGDPDWHAGVIGIVAARLVEEFYRPTLLFTMRDGTWRGSARSIAGVHLVDVLERCADRLLQFGGHAYAAGAEVAADGLPALREALNRSIDIDPAAMVPEIDVDGAIHLDAVDGALLDDLGRLSPHGAGNPEPLFAALDAEIVGSPRVMGANGQHLSFWVRRPGGRGPAFRAVAFGMGERHEEIRRRGTRVELLCRPQWNEWQGRREVQLLVQDLRVPD